MGNDEAVIYGARHGEWYREYPPGGTIKVSDEGVVNDKDAPTKFYYPNAIKLNSIGGRDVQVGVICFDQETGERLVTEYDQDGEPMTPWDSLWASLDRQGMNRLIRELRRMRDRVYGKDE